MNNCDNAPWASGPTDEPLEDIILTDKEFEDFCAQKYGFPKPEQLPSVVGVFDPASMPRMWPETALRVVLNPDTVQPVADFSMALSDIASMDTKDDFPSEVFTDDDLSALNIWERQHWRKMETKSGKVYCPVSNDYYPETMKQSVFRRIFSRYVSTPKLLTIMQTVFTPVAREVEDILGKINDPSFHLPFKKAVNKKRKAMDSELELQENQKRKAMDSELELEEKQNLSKLIISSAYSKMLFNRYDPDEHSADRLLILRAMCPLREEDETEEEMV